MPSDDDEPSSSTRITEESEGVAGASGSNWGLWFWGSIVVILGLVIGWFAWLRDGNASRPIANSGIGSVVSEPAPVATAPAVVASGTAGVTAPDPSSSSAASNASPFTNEREYWDELERTSATDPSRALRLALDGERWYSDRGRPAEARRAMIVSLLVDMGKMSEARDWTRRFIQQYPDSSFRPLVQGKTGIHPRPGRDGRIP